MQCDFKIRVNSSTKATIFRFINFDCKTSLLFILLILILPTKKIEFVIELNDP